MGNQNADDEPLRQEGMTTFESKLVRLLALHLVHQRQQPDQIDLLSRAGFKPVEIADLLATTSNTVNVCLSTLRAERKKKRGGKKAKKRA